MGLWNITYKLVDEPVLLETMNKLRPDSYNVRRKYGPNLQNMTVSTMVELTEEEAFVVTLTANIQVERLE